MNPRSKSAKLRVAVKSDGVPDGSERSRARTAATPARRRSGTAPASRPVLAPTPARAPRSRPATHARAVRLLIVFLVVLTAVAVGRIALSFAVVQKTMATETVVAKQRQVVAENAQSGRRSHPSGSSMTRIRAIALRRLDLVPATGVVYLSVGPEPADGGGAER